MRRLLAAALCAAAIGGCGDDEESPTTTTTATAQPSSTTVSESTTTTSIPQDETTTATTEPTDDTPSGATDPVVAATAVLTSQGTPEQACDLYVTPNFIETAYGGRENCIASRTGRALARDLSLGTAIEKGATHLVVIPQGGPYDGAKVEVDLIREGDTYRVDSLQARVPAGP